MHADRIYVLERGRIAEMGLHGELVEAKGLYYAMWRQQVGERREPALAAAGRSEAARTVAASRA
jgi:ATP-binding cassette subfamily B protein